MNSNEIQGLTGMLLVLGILVLLILPSLLGIARDRRIDRQIREAQEKHRADEERERAAQKSSSRSTVPSTATWYAEGRRSKKFVSS